MKKALYILFILTVNISFGQNNFVTKVAEIKADSTGNVSLDSLGKKFIPITGTIMGSPFTGILAFKNDDEYISIVNTSDVNQGGIYNNGQGAVFKTQNNLLSTTYGNGTILMAGDDANSLSVECLGSAPVGIVLADDYSGNYTDFALTQKIYVDAKINTLLGNDEITLSTDDPSIYDAGTTTLTIPANKGKIKLIGTTGQGVLQITNIVTSTPNIPLIITKAVSGTTYQFITGGNILTKNYGNPALILDDVDYIKIEWFIGADKFQTVDYWTYD